MKKLLSILFFTLFLTSCRNSEAFDRASCYQSVQKVYPQSTIYPFPENDYNYVVVDSCGGVHHVKTMSSETSEITQDVLIKPCK